MKLEMFCLQNRFEKMARINTWLKRHDPGCRLEYRLHDDGTADITLIRNGEAVAFVERADETFDPMDLLECREEILKDFALQAAGLTGSDSPDPIWDAGFM